MAALDAPKPVPSSGRLLIIGYGNPLRGDDGVGPRVATAAAAWSMPGLSTIAVHQLTPELADPLAATELAIFVDARLIRRKADVEIEVMPLNPSDAPRLAGHTSDPRSLLTLTRAIFGHSPRSWLVTIPGESFALGERFSPIAECGAEAALMSIAALIESHRGCSQDPSRIDQHPMG